jgi:amidohydrolase
MVRQTTVTDELTSEIIRLRREIHRNPELTGKEIKTAALIADKLQKLGISFRKHKTSHGVEALIKGTLPGGTVALRADMDALPVQEMSGLPFSSLNKGVMHACGHDAHSAMLMGAAELLVERKDEICGNVKLIFQPAEEGGGGARSMVAEGVLKPDVGAVFGLHVDPMLDVGTIGCRTGAVCADVGIFGITIESQGGHSALPHLSVNALSVASKIIQEIEALPSSKLDATNPVVITTCFIESGVRKNIIPGTATLGGTIRTLSRSLLHEVNAKIETLVTSIANMHGASCTVNFTFPSSADATLRNDAEATQIIRSTVIRLYGKNAVAEIGPYMFGEDFACYANEVPASLVFLGVGNGEERYPLHSANFTLDESALPYGAALLAETAISYLADRRGTS